MVRNIVVIGWGQIADLLCEFPEVVGYVQGGNLEEIISLESRKVIGRVNPDFHLGVIGIGKSSYKLESSTAWLARGYRLGKLVHSSAYVSPRAKIGEGSVVMPLAFIDGASTVGRCSIIGPQCAVRVASIGNYCHLAIQSKVLPKATIEDCVFLGAGSTVLEGVMVCNSSVLGASATASKDIPSKHLYIERSRDPILREIQISYPLTEREKLERKLRE